MKGDLCRRNQSQFYTHKLMEELERLFRTQTPDGFVEGCRTVVRKGLDIGLVIGETLNEWIDRLFNLIENHQN